MSRVDRHGNLYDLTPENILRGVPSRSAKESRVNPPPYVRPRTAKDERISRVEKEWPTMYLSLGLTIQMIANEYRVSYSRVRDSLRDQGVTLRKQGGRGSLRASPLVRLAKLEDEFSTFRDSVEDRLEQLAEALAILSKE